MWSNDRFFQKQNQKLLGTSYVEDILRTYKPQLPYRKDETYQRALQFREAEKARVQALADENTELKGHLARHKELYSTLSETLQEIISNRNVQLSKADSDKNGASASSSSVGTRSDGISPLQKPDPGPHGGVTPSVQHEVLPADVPNPRGQSEEHSDAGRSTGDKGLGEQPAGGDVPAQ